MSRVMREIPLDTVGNVIIGSTLQEVSPEEIIEAKRQYHLTGKCDHTLVQDEEVWCYYCRTCAVCGHGLGLL